MIVLPSSPVNLARHWGVRWLAKCGVIEKARWWIMIFMDVTLWGSQPSHSAVYKFEVDVITEVVDNIDVVLPLYRLF